MGTGVCVEKIGSVQIFQEPDGSYTGYDFANNKFIKDPYGDKPKGYRPVLKKKSPEEIEASIAEVMEYPFLDLPSRALDKATLEYFGIRIGVSEEDGVTPQVAVFPYYIGKAIERTKVKVLDPKKMWSFSKGTGEVDLFGWQQAIATGDKTLYITEGEWDAAALFKLFKDKAREYDKFKGTNFAERNPAVVSVPNGAGSAAKYLSSKVKEIYEHFKEVVLVFDNDDAGKKAVEETMRVMPEAMVCGKLPEKDVNDCLINGKAKAAFDAIRFRQAKPVNSRIVNADSLFEAAKKPAEWGLSFPWPELTNKTRGLRFGETYYFGAAPKMGKSEVVNQLATWFAQEHGLKVFMAKPEEANVKTYKLLAGKIAGKKFHDPTVPFDEEAFDATREKLDGKFLFLDLYQHVNWESLKGDIRAVAATGVKLVFIDPITNLTNGMSASEANEMLQAVSQELSAMAKDLDVAIMVFCHLKNPDAGPPHDRGGKVLSSQFAGSRAMARSCNYMFGLEGDKDDSLPKEQRNMRYLVLLEDREFGETARIPLYWDDQTTLFNEA